MEHVVRRRAARDALPVVAPPVEEVCPVTETRWLLCRCSVLTGCRNPEEDGEVVVIANKPAYKRSLVVTGWTK